MKIKVTNLLKNRIAKVYKKVISISVSFFNFSKNCIFDLFYNLYIGKELINIY